MVVNMKFLREKVKRSDYDASIVAAVLLVFLSQPFSFISKQVIVLFLVQF